MSAPDKAVSIDVSKYPEHALIREADGLTVDEKLLLYTVASHKNGVSFAAVAKLRDWTGLSRNRFYKARGGLLKKGLLSEEQSRGGATTYRLRKPTLQLLARQGVARRWQGKRPDTTSTNALRPPVPVAGTTPPHVGQGSAARTGPTPRDGGGHAKENAESNTEDIKNMKSSRKIRPPQRNRSGNALPQSDKRAMEAADVETVSDQKARLRARITEHRKRREGA